MDDNQKMFSILEEILKKVLEVEKGVNRLEKRMDNLEKKVDNLEKRVDRLEKKMDIIEDKMNKIESRMDKFESRMDKFESRLDKHERYTCNEFERLQKKIDYNFKYLDKKIDSTKDKMISATVDEIDRFSATASRLINNVDNKIETESKERIFEIERLNNLTEYDKIILKNLESCVSILEEETQKYNEK